MNISVGECEFRNSIRLNSWMKYASRFANNDPCYQWVGGMIAIAFG